MSNDLLSYLPSKATQDEIKTNVDSVKTDVASVKTDVGTVNTNVTSVKNDVATVKTNVGTVNTNVDSVKSTVTSINTTVGTINTNASTAATKATAAASDVATVKTNTATNNTASSTGTLSQKLSYIISNSPTAQTSSIFCKSTASSNVLLNVITSERQLAGNEHIKVYVRGVSGTLRITMSARGANYSSTNSSYRPALTGVSMYHCLYGVTQTSSTLDVKFPSATYVTKTADFTITPDVEYFTINVSQGNTNAVNYCNLLTICGTLTASNSRFSI